MNIKELLTAEFSDAVVLDFLHMHAVIAEEEAIKNACITLIPYIAVEPDEEE